MNITQPTLSYHMKNLCDCGLVSGRKDGKWMYYALNDETVRDLRAFLDAITSDREDCVCRDAVRECRC
ncbi:MAG: ArsR family transcriptional regulator [Deltaproteobacteria bacterium]|nr:ArsR family transcriptional regulator [Deltaproteobacteria bacterium]